jgi:2-C-methyl-D-erythritol 4-phosphate cytidylyltransferase
MVRVWAVVPAAGAGRRMGAAIPKQYLTLRGRPVLAHTLDRLAADASLHAIVVAISGDDAQFRSLPLPCRVPVFTAPGGRERADSVMSALRRILATAAPPGIVDWALVHDAVRPCLHPQDLRHLIETALHAADGALLATPTRDTMKRVREGRVCETVPRDDLWHALTPQMYPAARLLAALEQAAAAGLQVTDETQAMERAGCRPQVVHGRADNIKITRAEDLELAAWFLARLED